jgi:hypothetical protein
VVDKVSSLLLVAIGIATMIPTLLILKIL